ncbi:hypothetical protein FSP39_023765 [Pinctada imbricata]|uniref:Uncharacterized protein n=1 Tax=Pinctada imbricata TaxID=66713 RepID=A0AA89C8M8_PINIB|nr:hypothetical protein FSP39_023765 [Pinctada imbricata]
MNNTTDVRQTGLKQKQNSLPETSFDSGYCSPMHRPIKIEPPSPELPMLSNSLQVSPLKMTSLQREDSLMNEMLERPSSSFEDTGGIASEWEKDFFNNFEENLFNFDFDEKTIDDILKSPKGKVAMNELMRSPKGKAIMNSPKGKMIKDKMRYYNTPEHSGSGMETFIKVSPGILSPSDPNLLSATPMKPNTKSALKISRRKLALVASGKEDVEDYDEAGYTGSGSSVVKFKQIGPNSVLNCSVVNVVNNDQIPTLASCSSGWPSKEKLKFARDIFKRTLEKAVEEDQMKKKLQETQAEVKTHVAKKKKKSVKFQENHAKYPELKHALEKPSISKRSKRNRFPSIKLRESKDSEKEINSTTPFYPDHEEEEYDDEDLDEDYGSDIWKSYVPFTGYREAKKRRNSSEIFKVQSKRKKIYY